MRSVSPSLGLICNVTDCAPATASATASNTAPMIPRPFVTRMKVLEPVGIVARHRPERRSRRASRWLGRDDRSELREKEFSHIRRSLPQRRISRADDLLVFTNPDGILHPSEREGWIERPKAAQHGRVEIDVSALRKLLGAVPSAHDRRTGKSNEDGLR